MICILRQDIARARRNNSATGPPLRHRLSRVQPAPIGPVALPLLSTALRTAEPADRPAADGQCPGRLHLPKTPPLSQIVRLLSQPDGRVPVEDKTWTRASAGDSTIRL